MMKKKKGITQHIIKEITTNTIFPPVSEWKLASKYPGDPQATFFTVTNFTGRNWVPWMCSRTGNWIYIYIQQTI